jgi:putative ABC transport system permease protein
MRLVLVAIAIGLAGSLALTRLIAGLLYEVRPADPLTFLAIALLLAAVALFACYLPARRATRVDPALALRSE